MHNTTRGIDRRTLVLATGAAGVVATLGRPASAQDAPTATAQVGVSEDGYRTDEQANVGFYPLNTNIFESLVYLTPEYQIEPLLAESWELVKPTTWRITLRQDVTFHDGTPFNADAVKYGVGVERGTVVEGDILPERYA